MFHQQRLVTHACCAFFIMARAAAAANMTVHADLTDAARGLIRGKLSIPVTPGPLTLVYPKWIPGDHAPTGPITDLSDLRITADGKPVTWRRDLVDMYAIHIDVPPGANSLDVNLEYLSPTAGGGDANTTSQLVVLNWNLIVLLPQGSDAAKINVEPSIELPSGWSYGCSMEKAGGSGATTRFQPVSLEMLIDQPVIAGRHFKQLDLSSGSKPQHVIDVAADSDEALAIDAERLSAYRRVPGEYAALFGARHYERYHFLLALSDHMHPSGLEHHQCSDNRAGERALIDNDVFENFASLLTHEYFHSWNGKHRRPTGLLSPDYQKPMQDDLLWVYEGLTEYYGDVMAARAGLWKPEEYRERLASSSARLAATKGRTWRPLQDTADMAQKLYESGRNWSMRRRSVDFYDEGELIWLEADTLIRQKTDGKKSLDDFCRALHGEGPGGTALGGSRPSVVPYTVDDVYNALNRVAANDWKSFFTTRLTSLDPQPPLGGVKHAGWNLVYNKKSNKMIEAADKSRKQLDYRFSLGFVIDNDDSGHAIQDVVPDSPADKAGLGPGMKIVAVNGRKFDEDLLKDAVRDTTNSKSVELLIENGTYFSTKKLAYDGGARSPHLEHTEGTPDVLTKIIEPRVK